MRFTESLPRKKESPQESYSDTGRRLIRLKSLFIQTESLMQSAYGKLHVLIFYNDTQFNFRGTDHQNVDAFFRKGFERGTGDVRMGTHADTDEADLSDRGRGVYIQLPGLRIDFLTNDL